MRFTRFVAPMASVAFAAMTFAQTPPARPPATQPPITPTSPGSPVAPGTPPTTTTPTSPPTRPATPIAPGTPATTAPPAPIFRMDDVSRALTLNERQLTQLNAMTQRMQQKYQAQYDRLSRLPAAEQTNRLMELNREYTNAWLNGAKDYMNPTQLSRYQQLQLQYGGFATFNDPAIQRGLNLTDAQMKQLNDALLTSNTQLQDILKLAQTNPARAQQAYADYTKAYMDRLNLILTLEQQRQWSQMTGEPFPFPPPFGTGR